MERICLVHENTTSYLKNHWTKHRLVCTHFDAFFMLIPNMDMKVKKGLKLREYKDIPGS